MKVIDEIINDIEPSKPIFHVTLRVPYGEERQTRIRIERSRDNKPVYKGDKSGALVSNVMNHIDQDFDGKVFSINVEYTEKRVVSEVIQSLLNILKHKMPQKHPHETKMYKFFKSLYNKCLEGSYQNQEELYNALCQVYNYIASNTDDEADKNFLSIMKLLYHKHS